jgi:hypothetical protein
MDVVAKRSLLSVVLNSIWKIASHFTELLQLISWYLYDIYGQKDCKNDVLNDVTCPSVTLVTIMDANKVNE